MNKIKQNIQQFCRSILSPIFLCLITFSSHGTVMEYFWNEDPGVGKATKGFVSGDSQPIFSSEISVDGLPGGVNLLGVRVLNDKRWSTTYTYFVNVSKERTPQDLYIEYFFDSDPGIGKGSQLNVGKVRNGESVNVTFPTSNLSSGLHRLGYRVWDGSQWSATVLKDFNIIDTTIGIITAVEYFWGEDPGFGKGTAINISPNKQIDLSNLEIDFPEEEASEYVLNFRAKSNLGWGTTFTKIIPHLYVERIILDSETIEIAVGKSFVINAQVEPEDAFNPNLLWTSSDADVVSVNEENVLTALNEGNAIIRAQSTDGSNVYAECEVRVSKEHSGLDISLIDNVSVTAENGYIIIKNSLGGTPICICRLDGVNIFSVTSDSQDIIYTPDSRGIYLITVGSNIFKVII